jgi:hypothetical protein
VGRDASLDGWRGEGGHHYCRSRLGCRYELSYSDEFFGLRRDSAHYSSDWEHFTMSHTTFASHRLPQWTAAPLVRFRTREVAVHSDGLGAFRGLMIAVPLGGGMWVGLYYLVRAFL